MTKAYTVFEEPYNTAGLITQVLICIDQCNWVYVDRYKLPTGAISTE